MGPPPPRNPNPSPATADTTTTADGEPNQPNTLNEPHDSSAEAKTPMCPPPPPPVATIDSISDSETVEKPHLNSASSSLARTSVPYTIPEWSSAPCHKFYLEVLKDGSIIEQLDT